MNLIIEQPGMFQKAVSEWETKWVPAILDYSYTLAGKKASMVLSVQKKYEGTYTKHAFACYIEGPWRLQYISPRHIRLFAVH